MIRASDATGIAADNRRVEVRYRSEGQAEITIMDSGSVDPFEAKVLDVSRSGFRLKLGRSLREGQRVRVALSEVLAFARVRWCRTDKEFGFEAGLRIEHMVSATLISRVRQAAHPEDKEPGAENEEGTSKV